MIDINKLLAKHYNHNTDEDGNKVFYFWEVKKVLKDFGVQLLKEAANKSLVNPSNHDGYSYGIQDTIYIEPNENSEYFNFGGTCVVDKDSITSIINDINFD